MSDMNGFDIVVRIDNCLKAMGKTRENLAIDIGRNKQVFTDWKNRNIIPKSDDLYLISRYLNVPMEYLLIGETVMADDIAAMAAAVTTLSPEQRAPLIASVIGQVKFWKEKD